MGLTDDMIEGVWRWVSNGSAPAFTDWIPGQPNNLGNQDCVAFSYPDDYTWNDTDCTDNNLPICEKR